MRGAPVCCACYSVTVLQAFACLPACPISAPPLCKPNLHVTAGGGPRVPFGFGLGGWTAPGRRTHDPRRGQVTSRGGPRPGAFLQAGSLGSVGVPAAPWPAPGGAPGPCSLTRSCEDDVRPRNNRLVARRELRLQRHREPAAPELRGPMGATMCLSHGKNLQAPQARLQLQVRLHVQCHVH